MSNTFNLIQKENTMKTLTTTSNVSNTSTTSVTIQGNAPMTTSLVTFKVTYGSTCASVGGFYNDVVSIPVNEILATTVREAVALFNFYANTTGDIGIHFEDTLVFCQEVYYENNKNRGQELIKSDLDFCEIISNMYPAKEQGQIQEFLQIDSFSTTSSTTQGITMSNFSTLILNRIQENTTWNPEQLTRCLRTVWKNNTCQDDKSLDLVKTLISSLELDMKQDRVKFRYTPVVVGIFYHVHNEIYKEVSEEVGVLVEEVTLTPEVSAKVDEIALEVDIYTDGSKSSKSLCGGWGVYMSSNKGHTKELSGCKIDTTHNEMELEAMIQALTSLKYKEGMVVRIHTDSQYVLNAIFSIEKYKSKGFGKAKNTDYLQELLEAFEEKGLSVVNLVPGVIGNKELSPGDVTSKAGDISFIWVKGHSGTVGNDRADKLAVDARKLAEEASKSSSDPVVAEEVEEAPMVDMEALVKGAKTMDDIREIISHSKRLELGGTCCEDFTGYTKVLFDGKGIFEIVSPERLSSREGYIKSAARQLVPYLKEEGIYTV